MIYILDFDGVLFDDQRFKSDFQHVFSRYGVGHGIYEKTYHQAKEIKKGMYGLDAHIKLLGQINPRLDVERLRSDLFALARHSRRYIFPDAKIFLTAAQKRNDALFLLSTGDPLFQKTKVNASGLTPFFKEVIITTSSHKSPSLASIKKRAGREEVIFIDDKKEVVDELKKLNFGIQVIQMLRHAHVPKSKHADAHIKSFLEINAR